MTTVEQFNRRLGECLGYVKGGTQPRFQWMWAPNVPYWNSRLGAVWVVCQWQRPGMTEQEWDAWSLGRFAYPANGMHHAHMELALLPGMVPTAELTQKLIWGLDEQMSTSFAAQVRSANDDVAKSRADLDVQFAESSAAEYENYTGAFGNTQPGTRGGYLSFQNAESGAHA